jgi:SpoVK/Ycf46/Vps4 family AAA+-type ATPase
MSITLYSNQEECKKILVYIYECIKLQSNGKDISGTYIECEKHFLRDYSYKGESNYLHMIIPPTGIYNLDNVNITISDHIINNELMVIKYREKCYIIKKLELKAENDDILLRFIEKAISKKNTDIQNIETRINGKIKKKVYGKFGWVNNSTIPKRDTGTIFLKEGQMESIKKSILDFINPETYNDYVKHGIPYKLNILLHGSPGVGKTSLIHAIASLCDADICMLNINEELKEGDMIDAIRSIHDERLSIVVIEDIDCIFNDRKSMDMQKNHITMNGLLNCLDGFNNHEGMILIMTTNFPDKLDDALVRSGRIDMNITLTYLDKYQAKNMFLSFFPDEVKFESFWQAIKKYNIEPSSFLQFLFNNRKSSDITEHYKEYMDVLYKKHNKSNQLYT